MFLVYNSDILTETDYQVSLHDRAFQYGDGFFETLRYERNQLWFWPDHYARLLTGLKVLHLQLPNNTTETTVYGAISDLLTANGLTDQPARIKIQVWRQAGGLYTPATNHANILITARPGQPFAVGERATAGICANIRVTYSPWSAIKTLNSLPYVLAGIDKKERGLDEIILLSASPDNALAECQASNLFWFDAGVLHTPTVETGCINGILRQHILQKALTVGQPVAVGFYHPSRLATAEAVFSCNVNGIHWIRSIEGLATYPAGHQRANALFTGLL